MSMVWPRGMPRGSFTLLEVIGWRAIRPLTDVCGYGETWRCGAERGNAEPMPLFMSAEKYKVK